RDAFGNTTTSFTGVANLTTNAGAIAPPSTPFALADNGVKVVSITLAQPGTGRSITATSGANTGTSNTFTVNAGPLDHFRVEAAGGGNIATQQSGVPFNITITALDANDNTVLSFNGSANITSTGNLSIGGGASPNFLSGVLASLAVAISNSGTFTISATSGAAIGTSNPFVVGSIADLAVTMSGPAFTTAGGAPNY